MGAVNEPPELRLPAAAAELWAMVRDVVDDGLASLGKEPARYCIGGGTVLAARWQHRESFDIDLTLDRETTLGRLQADQGDPSQFETRLKALGGTPVYHPDLKLWRVAFDGGKRGLDLWAHELEIGAGEEERTVQGRVETVLSTAQILRGKLERTDMRLPRDVFDVIKAGSKAPTALESAVNAISAKSADLLALDWHWNSANIARDAPDQLLGIPEHERIDAAKLGSLAAHAIGRAVYTHCRIETRDGVIEVTTATRNRTTRTMRIPTDEAAKTFEASGLNGYVERAGPGARELREYALAECGRGRNVLVLNIEPDKPVQWRTERAGGNLTPGEAGETPHDMRNRHEEQPVIIFHERKDGRFDIKQKEVENDSTRILKSAVSIRAGLEWLAENNLVPRTEIPQFERNTIEDLERERARRRGR